MYEALKHMLHAVAGFDRSLGAAEAACYIKSMRNQRVEYWRGYCFSYFSAYWSGSVGLMTGKLYKKSVSTCCLLLLAAALLVHASVAEADESFKPGAKAQDFSLPDMSGRQVSLSQYNGKVVMLNFWATWCRPCRVEMPSMEKLYHAYRDKDFVILAVSVDRKGKGDVSEFVKKNGYTFPILLDPDSVLSDNYSVPYIPATFIIDRQGRIVSREYGARTWDSPAVRGKIDELLSKK